MFTSYKVEDIQHVKMTSWYHLIGWENKLDLQVLENWFLFSCLLFLYFNTYYFEFSCIPLLSFEKSVTCRELTKRRGQHVLDHLDSQSVEPYRCEDNNEFIRNVFIQMHLNYSFDKNLEFDQIYHVFYGCLWR